MTYTLDLSHDLEIMDDLDTFTLKVESQADIVLSDCVVDEPFDTREMEPSAGQVPQMDSMFIWPVYRSPVQPPLGSVLVDGEGIYWTILAIRRKSHVQTWEAHCRNLSIMPATANLATILKAVYTKGRANEAKATWQGLFSGQTPPTADDTIAARFQPSAEDAQIRFSSEWTRETYRVILSKKLPLTLANGEYRLKDEHGSHYRILHYADEQRLDRLPVAIAVRIIEGQEYFNAGQPMPLEAPVFPTV
jgi:hypothetical protein